MQDCKRSWVRSHRATSLDSSARFLPKLKEGAYSDWADAITNSLQVIGLWKYVTGQAVRPTDTSSWEWDLYELESSSVCTAIIGSIDESATKRYLKGVHNPKDVWALLKRHYCISDGMSLLKLLDELHRLKLGEGGNLIAHVATMRHLVCELAGSQYATTPAMNCSLLYCSLPPSFGYWVSNSQESGRLTDFEDLCIRLEAHYRNTQAQSESVVSVGAHAANVPNTTGRLSRSDALYVLPTNLVSCRITGAKNPALNDCACDTCRNCLLTGHRLNTPQCPQYQIRIKLWGPKLQHNGGNC